MENLMNVLFKFGLGSNILRIERINSGHKQKKASGEGIGILKILLLMKKCLI